MKWFPAPDKTAPKDAKYEFVLSINKNIICQRYFPCRDVNPNILTSMEIKECIDRCVDLIQENIKGKAVDLLWAGYNPYLDHYPEPETRNLYENEDFFTFELKCNGRLWACKQFPANDYPPKIRFGVDIRPIVPFLVSHIQSVLSTKKKLTGHYLDKALSATI